jgi:hypothetical protein
MPGRAASKRWHKVVLPPPEGAEMRINKGLLVAMALGWLDIG